MHVNLNRKLVAVAVAALAVTGGGAAIAASKLGSPKEESQAVINDAAQQLGVQPSALSDALKKALENRADAAVAAGTITKAQGDEMKSRIESGNFPLFFGGGGGPGFHHEGFFGGLSAAATYLGLTEAELRTQLEAGKTIAQVAQDKGKSVDGMIQALVDDAQKKLDAAVTAGKLTKDQEQSILTDLKQHITDLVNGVAPHGLRADHELGGGPPAI